MDKAKDADLSDSTSSLPSAEKPDSATKTWEVEQKYALTSLASFLHNLSAVGFERVEVQVHCDTYFRHPSRDFRVTDEAFRLRRVNDEAVVTYKGPRLDTVVKMRPETELAIEANDFDDWLAMFQSLGFEPLPSVRKTRQIFAPKADEAMRLFAGGLVTVDEVQELGAFAELECVINEEKLLQDAQRRVEQLSARLGLSQSEPRSYLSQLLEKLGVE